jgi:hypothetical protein|tara:strand:- start:9378 stop:9635 length:258 start_codon:yes stop_codon:yes gene_type:complete
MSDKVDLCYLPTNGLCKLNEILDDSFFPSNQENIIKQELITYEKIDGAIKKSIFQRNYIGTRHHDGHITEIFPTKLAEKEVKNEK